MRQRHYRSKAARVPKINTALVFERRLPPPHRGDRDPGVARPWQVRTSSRRYTTDQIRRWLSERVIRLRMLMARKHCSAERRAKLARKIKACLPS